MAEPEFTLVMAPEIITLATVGGQADNGTKTLSSVDVASPLTVVTPVVKVEESIAPPEAPLFLEPSPELSEKRK